MWCSRSSFVVALSLVGAGGCQVLFSEPTFDDGAATSSSASVGGGSTGSAPTTVGSTTTSSADASTGVGSTTASGGGGAPPAVCGNAVVEPGESCDDGNTATGDGCGSTCLHIVRMSEGSTGDHACVILANNRIKCWGANDYGQLGYEDNVNRGNAAGTMGANLALVDLGLNANNDPFNVTAVAVGGATTCARFAAGSVKCWGANFVGQLGVGDTMPHGTGAGQMGNALKFVNVGDVVDAITVGNGFACAIKTSNKRVVCWGANEGGQLAVGGTNPVGGTPYTSLAEVPLGPYEAKQISAGEAHVCAVLDDAGTDHLKCWGSNAGGQLGIEAPGNRGANLSQMGAALPFVPVGAVVSVAAGGFHTCARLVGDRVKCWGSNAAGQLGLADPTPTSVGTTVGSVASLAPIDLGIEANAPTLVQELKAGSDFTCVRTNANKTKCWGSGSFGELGRGDLLNVGDDPAEMGQNLDPVAFGATDPTTLEPHRWFSCALFAPQGITKCWGIGTNGALGYEDVMTRGDGQDEMGAFLPAQPLP